MDQPHRTLPHIDECRYLILKIIEQAVRDYLSLQYSNAPIEQSYYDTACQFLFDDGYTIDYGETEKTLNDLLDVLGLELDWFRERVVKLKDRKIRSFQFRRLLDEGNTEVDERRPRGDQRTKA